MRSALKSSHDECSVQGDPRTLPQLAWRFYVILAEQERTVQPLLAFARDRSIHFWQVLHPQHSSRPFHSFYFHFLSTGYFPLVIYIYFLFFSFFIQVIYYSQDSIKFHPKMRMSLPFQLLAFKVFFFIILPSFISFQLKKFRKLERNLNLLNHNFWNIIANFIHYYHKILLLQHNLCEK